MILIFSLSFSNFPDKPVFLSSSLLSIKNIVILLLASIILFYIGREFYSSAFNGLKNRMADMNLLVAIGTTAAYLYSISVLFFPDIFPENMRHLYFDGAAAIVTFVLLGRYLEIKAKNRANDFIKKLLSFRPDKAVIKVDGKEVEIPAENIIAGDIFVVKPGEKIPADGVIIKGKTEVDQSSLTGEPLPVFKQEGDTVLGGSINRTGLIEARATKSGKESAFYQILKLLTEAQERKPEIGKLADKITSVFVPVILIVSILTFDLWYFLADNIQYGFLSSVSVLIIACPCALGLAIPIAIVVAVGRGAKESILIKNPEVLEYTDSIEVTCFDKTGTVTEGKPQVVYSEILKEDLLDYIIPVLSYSNHPLSASILRYLKRKKRYDVSNIKQEPGKGIKGSVEGKEVVIGKMDFLKEEGIEIVYEKSIKGTPVFVAVDKKPVAVFYLDDRIKKEAEYVIKMLKRKGIKTVLLTGDVKEKAEEIGQLLGFDEIRYNLLPEDKYKIVSQYQKEGKKVLFVGDGINDAPVIEKSDIGIAVWQASDLAKEAGDIILLKEDLNLVLKYLNLSKKTYRIIKQNLFWAFIYNGIGIPLAAGLLYPFLGVLLNPVIAGIAMSFSSVSVVLNALRLRAINI